MRRILACMLALFVALVLTGCPKPTDNGHREGDGHHHKEGDGHKH
jgi:hypothetical protein